MLARPATTVLEQIAKFVAVRIPMQKLTKTVKPAVLSIQRPALALPATTVTVQLALLAKLALSMPRWKILALAPRSQTAAIAHVRRDTLGTVSYAPSAAVITKTHT